MKRGKADRDRLKIGFDGWLEFFGVPVFVIFFGAMILWYEIFPSEDSVNRLHWGWGAGLIAVGAALYAVQHRKLRFRTLGAPSDLDSFRDGVRKIMKKGGWYLAYDNKRFMQALYRGGSGFSGVGGKDMVTLRFRGGTVLYNIIKDPEMPRGGGAALLSRCRRGKRLIKEIRERLVNVQ